MQTIEYDVFKKAQELAAAKYTTVIKRDTLSDGSYCYVAHNPELEGCTGQGETELEAANDLAKARLDYIYFLLADGLEVPEPIMPIDGRFLIIDSRAVLRSKGGIDIEATIEPTVLYPAP